MPKLCCCGSNVRIGGESRHLNTKKHKTYMERLNQSELRRLNRFQVRRPENKGEATNSHELQSSLGGPSTVPTKRTSLFIFNIEEFYSGRVKCSDGWCLPTLIVPNIDGSYRLKANASQNNGPLVIHSRCAVPLEYNITRDHKRELQASGIDTAFEEISCYDITKMGFDYIE